MKLFFVVVVKGIVEILIATNRDSAIQNILKRDSNVFKTQARLRKLSFNALESCKKNT